MKSNLTRREKIKLLEDLKSGKVSIKELSSDTINLWFLENGKYHNSKTGERMTKKELSQKKCNSMNLLLMPCEGCEPIVE